MIYTQIKSNLFYAFAFSLSFFPQPFWTFQDLSHTSHHVQLCNLGLSAYGRLIFCDHLTHDVSDFDLLEKTRGNLAAGDAFQEKNHVTRVVDARNDLLNPFDADLFVFLKQSLHERFLRYMKDHEIYLISRTLSFRASPIEIWTFVLIENQIAIFVFSGGLLVTENVKMTLFYPASHLIVEDFFLSKKRNMIDEEKFVLVRQVEIFF